MSQKEKKSKYPPFGYKGEFNYEKNYVFYNRLKDKNQFQNRAWNRIYDTSLGKFNRHLNSSTNQSISNTQLIKSLRYQGKQEKIKEDRLFQKFFGVVPPMSQDYIKYINTVNTLIGLKDDFQFHLMRLKESAKDFQRGESAATYFEGYLYNAIEEGLAQWYNNLDKQITKEMILYYTPEQFEEVIDDIFEKSMYPALVKLLSKNEKLNSTNEQRRIWQSLIDNIDTASESYESIKSTIISKYKLKEIKQQLLASFGEFDLDDALKIIKAELKGTITKDKNNKIKNNKSKQNKAAAGLLQEFLSTLIKPNFNSDTYSMASIQLKSNKITTDTLTLFSLSKNIPIQKIVDNASRKIKGSNTFKHMHDDVQKYYDDCLKDIDDLFVIYGNNKLYSLGETFDQYKGFTAKSFKIDQLPSYLTTLSPQLTNAAGIKAKQLLINCCPGTIGQNHQTEVQQNISSHISRNMAKLLFDDWNEIGKSNNNSIHIFDLNSVKIPLSVLLLGAADALEKASSSNYSSEWFHIYFPDLEISYPEKTPLQEGETLIKRWNVQRSNFLEKKIEIKFLKNFREIINELIIYQQSM